MNLTKRSVVSVSGNKMIYTDVGGVTGQGGICSKTLSKCFNYERNRHFTEYYYKHSISKYNKKDEICVKSRPFFFVCFCVFPLKNRFLPFCKIAQNVPVGQSDCFTARRACITRDRAQAAD